MWTSHYFLFLPCNSYFLHHMKMQCFDWTVQSNENLLGVSEVPIAS